MSIKYVQSCHGRFIFVGLWINVYVNRWACYAPKSSANRYIFSFVACVWPCVTVNCHSVTHSSHIKSNTTIIENIGLGWLFNHEINWYWQSSLWYIGLLECVFLVFDKSNFKCLFISELLVDCVLICLLVIWQLG